MRGRRPIFPQEATDQAASASECARSRDGSSIEGARMNLPLASNQSARPRGLVFSILILLAGVGVASAADGPAKTGPMSLADCLAVGMDRQPAIAAARASYGAALAGQEGVEGLKFAGILSKELSIRKHQSAWGVNIAAAGVELAEWETRYAVIRTYFTVMYAYQQGNLLDRIIAELVESRKAADTFRQEKGANVSETDVLMFDTQISRLKARRAEAKWGMQKALSALREAMGFTDECPLLVIETPFPDLVEDITCKEVTGFAVNRRGELVQALSAEQLTAYEIEAQRLQRFKPKGQTFGIGSDVHSRPIPQGIANSEYRPGAIGLEMPMYLIGRRAQRINHAWELHDRAGAVVDKTRGLIILEAEVSFYKWKEAAERVEHLRKARETGEDAATRAKKRFGDAKGKIPADEVMRATTAKEETLSLYIEALYLHALSLAGLERVTSGGLRFT